MATNLGHHTVALRAATDDLPAKARQPPADKLAAALYSDDVLIIASEGHWYNVTPLNIRATDPQPLGSTHHEFCFLQNDQAANDACICCNPNTQNWHLPVGKNYYTATLNVTNVDTMAKHLVPGAWIDGVNAASCFRLSDGYARPPYLGATSAPTAEVAPAPTKAPTTGPAPKSAPNASTRPNLGPTQLAFPNTDGTLQDLCKLTDEEASELTRQFKVIDGKILKNGVLTAKLQHETIGPANRNRLKVQLKGAHRP
eukprot:SAG25_NODE_437_length_8033_cov_16.194199_10_plen_255_part_01